MCACVTGHSAVTAHYDTKASFVGLAMAYPYSEAYSVRVCTRTAYSDMLINFGRTALANHTALDSTDECRIASFWSSETHIKHTDGKPSKQASQIHCQITVQG